MLENLLNEWNKIINLLYVKFNEKWNWTFVQF